MMDKDPNELRRRWDAMWTRLKVPSDRAPSIDPLLAAYEEPARAYHNLRHILQCLHELDGLRDLCDDPDAVEMAIWYHDAIYDPTGHDNEDRSAGLARDDLGAAGLPRETINAVVDLILVTKHSASPESRDAQVMVDIDLSILGQKQEIFDEYERGIRREYAHVDEPAFRAGRAAILEQFLARPTLFLTPRMRDKFEARARENLARSTARLRT